MFFRREDAIGDEALVRSGEFNGQLEGVQGYFEIEAYGEKKYVFYDGNTGSGCTLLYIAGNQFFDGGMQENEIYYVILVSGLFLIAVNILIVILFNKRVYRPIVNVEGALHAIVAAIRI